jgi:2-polyprenyl-3-methyl-5-hydroxy-6-metoxy-1,4-benzoquinol methylase
LAERYRREYSIDVRRFLSDQEVTLQRDEASGVWMFRGGIPGDGRFYEQLHKNSAYYPEEKWEFSQAFRWLKESRADASILEIGCGNGAFLDLCRRAGFERLRGLELNASACRECREKGHDVSVEMIEQLGPSAGSFDYVCAFQILEHVPDPIGFLQAVTGRLRRGGKLILSTPNAASFLSRYKWCLLDLPPHHMSRWDATSFRRTAELLGLSVVAIRNEPLAKYHYRFFANSLVEHLPPGSLRRRAAKPIARAGFAACPWKKRIPGHTMLAVLSKDQRRTD